MSGRTGGFGRTDRLLRPREFQRVSSSGRRVASEAFTALATPGLGGAGRHRLGVTVSRKVGNSIVRNRVKRRIREWFRHGRAELGAPLDIVIIARRPAATLAPGATGTALERLLSTWSEKGSP